MPRTVRLLTAPTLVDVNGNAIAAMSNATFLDGYTTAITGCFGARHLIVEIKDIAGGAAVAPSACAAGFRNTGSSTYSEDINFTSHRHNGVNMIANFWRTPAARLHITPVNAGNYGDGMVFVYDELRVHLTIGATANLFTPAFRVWRVEDELTLSPS